MRAVLLLTHDDDDYCTPMVAEAIRARGALPLVFPTNRFPSADWRVGLRFPVGHTLVLGGERITQPLTAIWNRRIAPTSAIEGALAGSVSEEARRTLIGLAEHGPFVMDSPTAVLGAHKVRQLDRAGSCGLRLPATVHTSDPDEARQFVASHPGGVIAKMMHDVRIRPDRSGPTIYTNLLKPEDIEAIDDLMWCPMTLQAKVPSAAELRIICVGEQVFAAALENPTGALDWRRTGARDIERWEPWTLPQSVREGVIAMQRQLGLNYGAYDFIVEPTGHHVFLEVNPQGEWFWLQRWPGLPIAEAIADTLLGDAPRIGAA